MKTGFKGTKGKWSFSAQRGQKNHCVQAQIWSDKQEEYVANINSTEDESEATANAKLIAAAPDLLKALIEVVRISDRNHDAWDKAKKAIDKALA